MAMLSLGLLIWISVHLFPSLAPGIRRQYIGRLGKGYHGLFSLLVFAGLLLIVFGWRNSIPTPVFTPMAELRYPAMLLIVAGFILIVAANTQTRIKRRIRHPQLMGVLLWAAAHLTLNGDSRSIVMFFSIGLWCWISMHAINRREGAWVKPDIHHGWGQELRTMLVGAGLSAVAFYFHHYLSGINLAG